MQLTSLNSFLLFYVLRVGLRVGLRQQRQLRCAKITQTEALAVPRDPNWQVCEIRRFAAVCQG